MSVVFNWQLFLLTDCVGFFFFLLWIFFFFFTMNFILRRGCYRSTLWLRFFTCKDKIKWTTRKKKISASLKTDPIPSHIEEDHFFLSKYQTELKRVIPRKHRFSKKKKCPYKNSYCKKKIKILNIKKKKKKTIEFKDFFLIYIYFFILLFFLFW